MSPDPGGVGGPARGGWALWIHAVLPVPELVEIAVRAEERGAFALLVADEGVDRDLYVTLAAVAVATSRIALIPAITNPHSRHPVATAAALASLAELAPDRVVAGLGAGGNLVFGPMGLNPRRPYSALAETVDVVGRLLDREVVTHVGEFTAQSASLAWSPGRLPLAVAGRGPRVESLGASTADWVILAGKAVDDVDGLVARLRRDHQPPPSVIWNPAIAWRPEHAREIRSHFSYMTVDLPPAERAALGVTEEDVAVLRRAVLHEGPEAASALVPEEVLRRYAILGTRDEVLERLSAAYARTRPELVAFSAHEYSLDFVDEVADLAAEAGLRATDRRGSLFRGRA